VQWIPSKTTWVHSDFIDVYAALLKKMAKTLPEYPQFTPSDTPKDAAAWSDWLEGFQAMLDAMQIPDDADAVVDEANPENNTPAKRERYRLFWHYMGTECRKRLKNVMTMALKCKTTLKQLKH